MKTLATICLALLAACAEKPPPPPQPLTVQEVSAPRDQSAGTIAGVVKARDYGVVALDSGAPDPIPLRVDPELQIVKDDRPATALDIAEGDMVRAAYVRSESGEARAITVVANSRPVSARAAPPPTAHAR
jgi:hypothetical protein